VTIWRTSWRNKRGHWFLQGFHSHALGVHCSQVQASLAEMHVDCKAFVPAGFAACEESVAALGSSRLPTVSEEMRTKNT